MVRGGVEIKDANKTLEWMDRKEYKRHYDKSRNVAKEKRFRVWDGEGWSDRDGKHWYCLFGHSDGAYVTRDKLGTYELLQFIMDERRDDVWNVAFAFDYDVNMILRDLTRRHLIVLRKKNKVCWDKFIIQYVPHKWFRVTDRQEKKTVTIEDVWAFFQASFVNACKAYGVELSSLVIEGKEARGSFNRYLIETQIIPYWKEENQKAVELMNKLRESLESADIKIRRWYGPGVIANYTMKAHGIKNVMGDSPDIVKRAAQFAYAGGRFECFKVGHMQTPVYEYDINSAYPYAISKLPNLAEGEWYFVEYPETVESFGMYCVASLANGMYEPSPFFVRNDKGMVSYPGRCITWVWGPELQVAIDNLAKRYEGKEDYIAERKRKGHKIEEIIVLCGFVFRENDPHDRPFEWITDTYALRQRYKREGNGAEKALKLQMNSMYGKMAQRVGWNEKTRKAPSWHCLEWAGWVTSHCRAQILEAANMARYDLVSIETDAVFSLKPLPLKTGTGLGYWEETKFDDFVSLQSGCRFGRQGNEWLAKYRGFDKGSITIEAALEAINRQRSHDGFEHPKQNRWTVMGKTTRFIGMGWAIQNNFDKWQCWETADRELLIGAEGKRIHVPFYCFTCTHYKDRKDSLIHDCITPSTKETQFTYPHHIPWYDGLSREQEIIDDNRWWNV